MLRTIAVAGLLALAATAAQAAQSADTPPAATTVTYKVERLGSESGREQLRKDAANEIDAYCRAHPVEGTVAQCRAALEVAAKEQIEAKATEYAANQGHIKLTADSAKTRTPR